MYLSGYKHKLLEILTVGIQNYFTSKKNHPQNQILTTIGTILTIFTTNP